MEAGIRAVRIDPKLARTLLDMNTSNRPKTWSIIKAYADNMKAGRWKLNGETLKITTSGVILDGQHRLEACIMSGTPFDTYFVRVEDATAFDTIDIGRKRTGADVLAIEGEVNTNSLAAALALMCEYEGQNRLRLHNKRRQPSEIKEMLDKHPDIRASVAYISRNQKACDVLMTRSVAIFCHYLFSRINEEDARTFMEQVISGENLQRTDAAWALRNRLVVERAQKHKGSLRNSYLAALIIKAWNYYRSGKPCNVLKYLETEDFPVPK